MSLQKLRSKIDSIDSQIVRLLNQRAKLSLEVGSLKKAAGQSVFDPVREKELLDRLATSNGGPLEPASIHAIYREILAVSRSLQQKIRVAYLGPVGTYSHQAALMRFGRGSAKDSVEAYVACRSIPEIFATVSRGEAETGVVPIENSTEGGVTATHDALVNTDLVVNGESFLKIQHAFAAKNPKDKIRKIYSHQQVLGQCRQWLAAHYPGVQPCEVPSTTEGARKAATEKGAAAIASPFAAEYYGLSIITANISDAPNNTTRFFILGRDKAAPSKKDKTSLIFAVQHRVGALGEILAIFARSKINLCKIESRPAPFQSWEYFFFVDVKGHQDSPALKAAFAAVRKKTIWLKILGSYPEGRQDV